MTTLRQNFTVVDGRQHEAGGGEPAQGGAVVPAPVLRAHEELLPHLGWQGAPWSLPGAPISLVKRLL